MKQKKLLLKGMAAAAVTVLLVFAVGLTACDNSTSTLIPYDPDLEDLQEIKNVQVEAPQVSITSVTVADIDGIFGYKLVWNPVYAVGTYEVWRTGSGYEERVKSISAPETSGPDIGKFVVYDIVKLDTDDEPTLVAGGSYTYTVIAIPIMGNVRDTAEWKQTVTAPAIVAQDTPIPAPSFDLTIAADAWKFVMQTAPAEDFFPWPVDFIEWELINPKGDEVEGTGLGERKSDHFGDDAVEWKPAAWRSLGPEGTYTLQGTAGTDNGYFAKSEVAEDTGVYKLMFQNADFAADIIDGGIRVDLNNTASYVEGFFARMNLNYNKTTGAGIRAKINENDEYVGGITYTIQRAAAVDGKPSGDWTEVELFKTGRASDMTTKYVEVEFTDMKPDIFGVLSRLTTDAEALGYVYDYSIPYAKDGGKYIFRIKGVDADGVEEYVLSGAVEIENHYKGTTSLAASDLWVVVGYSLINKNGDDEVSVRYQVSPKWDTPYKRKLAAGDVIEFYWKGSGGCSDGTDDFIPALNLTGGYDGAEYTGDITRPLNGKLVFSRDDIENLRIKYFEIDLLEYAEFYDGTNDPMVASDVDEIWAAAFLLEEDGTRTCLWMDGFIPTSPATTTTPPVAVTHGEGITTADLNGAIRQYELVFTPDDWQP